MDSLLKYNFVLGFSPSEHILRNIFAKFTTVCSFMTNILTDFSVTKHVFGEFVMK